MSKRDKGRLPPFVPLLISTIDAPAWKAMSLKWLYVALRRRMPNGRNRAFVSYRMAQEEGRDDGKYHQKFIESARLSASLATKLQLTPSSRCDARQANRNSNVVSDDRPRPWERRAAVGEEE